MKESNSREWEINSENEESRNNGKILLCGENLETLAIFSVLTCTHYICDLNMSLILTNKHKAVLKGMHVKGKGRTSIIKIVWTFLEFPIKYTFTSVNNNIYTYTYTYILFLIHFTVAFLFVNSYMRCLRELLCVYFKNIWNGLDI